MRTPLFVAVAMLDACASLPTLGAECGNGVLEPGEDCDTPGDPRCQMCGWTCNQSASDCTSIPAPKRGEDYTCGVDGFCHAPGGELAPQSGAPVMQVESFYVTDVNDDGYGDAVGIAGASLETCYGDPTGQLADSVSIVTAGAAGDIAIADIDGDGELDAILPTRDGLVAYASPYGAVLPYAFTLEVAGVTVTPLALLPLDGVHFITLYVVAGVGAPAVPQIQGVVFDLTATPPQDTSFALCDTYDPNSFDPSSLDYYNTTNPAAPTAPSVTFTFVATSTSGVRELCGVSMLEPAGGGTPQFILSPLPAPQSRAVLAELDESGCPSLFVGQGSASMRYRGSRQGGQCAIAGSAAMPAVGEPGDTLIGHVPLSPRITGLTPDTIVTTSGVWGIPEIGTGSSAAANPSGMPQPLYLADRPLTEAASGDIDGDGNTDGVALGNDSTFDVLYRTVAPDGFLRGRLATDAVPSHLVVADFDGNGVDDISYVEGAPRGDALQIVYGTVAGLLPAVDAADFGSVIATVRIAPPDSNDPNGLISGLAVAESRTAAAGSLSVASLFNGSVDRALMPFLDLRGGSVVQSTFRAVVGGHFVESSNGFDMLAIEIPDADVGGPAELWQFQGGAPGAVFYPLPMLGFMPDTGEIAFTVGSGAVVDCSLTGNGSGEFCIDGAKLVDWSDTTDDNSDHLIAIDAQNAAAFDLDPSPFAFEVGGSASGSAIGESITCDPGTSCLPMGATLNEAFASDLDGDGANELVLAYGSASAGGVLACSVPTDASGIACHDLTNAQVTTTTAGTSTGTCWDAVPGRFALPSTAPNTGVQLAMVCDPDGAPDATVYRVVTQSSAGTFAFTASPLVTLPIAASAIVEIGAHDVNGDSLDDLLVLANDPDGVRRLHVFLQLTSRQVAQ